MNMWRAGCGGNRTSGSEGGQEKPTSRKADRALLSDPYTEHPTPWIPRIVTTLAYLFS
jgi:putative transposase